MYRNHLQFTLTIFATNHERKVAMRYTLHFRNTCIGQVAVQLHCKVDGFTDFEDIENGDTILHWAVRSRDNETLQLLLSWGMDPNTPRKDGQTPLHLAAANHDEQIIFLLVSAGADTFGAVCQKGWTPFHYLADSSNNQHAARDEIWPLNVMQARASVEVLKMRDSEGRTAYDIAMSRGALEVANVLEKLVLRRD